MNNRPYIITFPKIGEPSLGYISVAEKENLPFIPKRIYWTYFTPESIERGGHSHKELEQVLIAVAGTIVITTETSEGDTQKFVLDNPQKGLFIPRMCWRTMQYSHNAVQLCMASLEFDEADYIREYEVFKQQ